jgi:hypothetical protein
MNPDDDIEEVAAQMEKDFEDYKKKTAVGAYPEAEDVDEDVRKMQEKKPDVPEEAHRRLAVAYIAAKKRIKQRQQETQPPPGTYHQRFSQHQTNPKTSWVRSHFTPANSDSSLKA